MKPALLALQDAFANTAGPDRPGGRGQAIAEFRDFVNGPRVPQLLADPGYDDPEWPRPPPNFPNP